VSDDFFSHDENATPLTAEEREKLIPTHVTTRRELNDLESEGVTEAELWAFNRRRNVLDPAFLLTLHRRMFGKVWGWAGAIRTTGKSIGVDPTLIRMQLDHLLDDVRYWIRHAVFPADEIAARFHHCLVAIHPFVNGNGRHARMAADLLLTGLGRPRFTWGVVNLAEQAHSRRNYIQALKAADRHDMAPLLAFTRS
jgi:Fic-DOC domain mobile mystery protein B